MDISRATCSYSKHWDVRIRRSLVCCMVFAVRTDSNICISHDSQTKTIFCFTIHVRVKQHTHSAAPNCKDAGTSCRFNSTFCGYQRVGGLKMSVCITGSVAVKTFYSYDPLVTVRNGPMTAHHNCPKEMNKLIKIKKRNPDPETSRFY